jgi:ABC-type xylose transport system permease subunit
MSNNRDRVRVEESRVQLREDPAEGETRIRESRYQSETRVEADDGNPAWQAQAARERHIVLIRITRVIWLIAGILEALIGLRFLLKLIAANPHAGFAQFIYSITAVFLVPFQGLTATPSAGGAVLEISSLIAMLVYGLLAWGVVRAVWVLFDRPA